MQSQNLNYTALMNQPMVFSPQNPPFIPQVSRCPQYLQQYLGYIAASIATVIGQSVQQNPHAGRVFTFNQLSNNNYANNEFAQAVATTVDFIALHIHKGFYPQQNIEASIIDAVPRVLSIVTSLNIVNCPNMHYMLDPNIVNEARRVVQQEAAQLQHEVVQFNMATSGPQQMAMGQGYSPQQPIYGQQPMNPGYGARQVQTMPPRTHMPRQNAAIVASGFGSGPSNNTQSNVQLPGGNRYNNPNRVRQQTAQQEVPIVTEPVVLVWAPSRKQAYLPAYRPSTEEVVLVQDYDPISSVEVVVMQIKTKEEESAVNRDQHTMIFKQSVPVPSGFINREQAFDAKLTEHTSTLEGISVHPRNKEVAKVDVPTDKERVWKYSTSLASSVQNARYMQMVTENGKTAYKSSTEFVLLGNVFISNNDMRDIIHDLRAAVSFNELQVTMKDLLGSDSSSFARALNKYVTDEFNQFLALNVGLTKFAIDSFIEDYSDAEKIIKERRGMSFFDSMIKQESSFIAKIFLNVDDDTYNEMLSIALDGIWLDGKESDRTRWSTAVIHAVSVTVCDIPDEVIDLATPSEELTAFVDSVRFPAFEAFGQAILKLQESDVTSGITLAHNYLVSSDNTVYEIIRGLYDTVLVHKKASFL